MDGNETPEIDESYDFIKELEEYHATWERKHPFLAWLNDKFPKGYAHYSISHIVTHPWEILRYWNNEVKYAWQRVFRGWDDTAIWSVDYYLSKLIVSIMKDYLKYNQGIPVSFFAELGLEEDVFENGVIGYNDEKMKIATDEWNKMIGKIIIGFESHLEMNNLSPYRDKEKWDEAEKKVSEGFDLLKKYYSGLWT